jgi:hypothetical protein
MDKVFLLKEYASFEYDKEDKETSEALKDRTKPMFLTGVIQRYDVLNKNGRVYGKNILLPEIENYNNVFVKGDSAWGELDHCLHEDYQIYTTEGWKYLKDISSNEEIYTLNPNSNLIEKEKITRKVQKSYSGTMHKLYSKNKELVNATAEHNFILWNRYNKVKKEIAENLSVSLERKSRELAKSHFKISGKWNGNKASFYEIPGTKISMPINVWAAFFGIWIAKGYVAGSKSEKNKKYTIGITQKKPSEILEIRNLLNQTGMNWKEYHRQNGTVDFVFSNKAVHSYFKQFGNSSQKFIPKEFLNWNTSQLEILLSWMLKGDGRNRKKKNGDLIREYSTVSPMLASNVEEMFFKLGSNSRITKRQQSDSKIDGRVIPSENCKPLFTVSENKSKIYLDFRFMKEEKTVVENETVYCVTTRNGNFLTRHKETGRAHWTGNCDSPIVSTKNISHIIKKIWVEGNAVKAKIQILNNPNGDIVRSMVEAGGKPGISSRAVGSLEKRQFGNDGVVDYVGEDLQIICWDIVSEPSTPGAYMALTEARELNKEELKALNEYNTKFGVSKRNHKLNQTMNEILSLRKTK